MKNKIIFIVFFLILMSGTGNVNAQVPDTSSYVRSIVANKSKYIGKTFYELEKDLKIQIKYFFPSLTKIDKTKKEYFTLYYFSVPKEDDDFDNPSITISWDSYLDIYVSKSILDNMIENRSSEIFWNTASKKFYKNAIIKDIDIFGEGKKTDVQ